MHRTEGSAWIIGGFVLAAVAAATGCATGAGGALGGAPSAPYVQSSDGPELVGTASLPNDAGAPAVLATALVLQNFAWPITGVDSARGALDSDWQYFAPAVRASARKGVCQNPMALRFTVRTMNARYVRIAAEAYVPRTGASAGWRDSVVPDDPARREALSQARAVLASLRTAVAASGLNDDAALRAWSAFGRQLEYGGYHRCTESPS